MTDDICPRCGQRITIKDNPSPEDLEWNLPYYRYYIIECGCGPEFAMPCQVLRAYGRREKDMVGEYLGMIRRYMEKKEEKE